ncbi:MAG: minor capsid protein [Burkholderiaceae bacterium]|nr:minor capsid protein [Burkholderiaceae bacterium]
MSAASEFAQLARLRPAEAIAYMDGRKLVAETGHYTDLWRDQHERAFTISRLHRADLLEKVQESLSKAVAGDLTRRDWIQQTRTLLQKEGFWGNLEVPDQRTGEIKKTTFNEARLRLIYDTNVRQALAAGQWQRMLRNRGSHPYARYVSMDDGRVRPEHRAWHNTVLPIDHPWWNTHRPPNGYHCRCRVVGVTRAEFERGFAQSRPGAETDENAPLVREDFKTEPPPEQRVAWRNPATGELQKVPRGIDPGFDYNPGTKGASLEFEEFVRNKLLKLSPAIREAAQKAGVFPPKVAKEVPGQDTWKTLGLPDLKAMTPRGETPELLKGADNADAAAKVLREALGVPEGGLKLVQTPTGRVAILDRLLSHLVEKRKDERERFAKFILPTLRQPDEVWSTAYDDDTTRRRYIKLFAGAKYDILVIVRELADGSVLWNVMNRERAGMNALRVGTPVYRRDGQ